MPEWGPLGSVRGALSNECPYRDHLIRRPEYKELVEPEVKEAEVVDVFLFWRLLVASGWSQTGLTSN